MGALAKRLVVAPIVLATIFVMIFAFQNCAENLPSQNANAGSTGNPSSLAETNPVPLGETVATPTPAPTANPTANPATTATPQASGEQSVQQTFLVNGTVTPNPVRLATSFTLSLQITCYYQAGNGMVIVSFVNSAGQVVSAKPGATVSFAPSLLVTQSFNVNSEELGTGDFTVKVQIYSANASEILFTADQLLTFTVTR